jgi:ATP-binding cassette subfamily B protein
MADGPIVLWRQSLCWLRPYWRQDVPILAAICVEISYWTLVPLALRALIDAAAEGTDAVFLIRILALLGIAFLISAAVSTGRMALTARLGANLLVDMRLRLFEHLQRLPQRFYTRSNTGDLVARFTTDLNTIESALTSGLPEVLWGAVALAIAVPLLYSLNIPMAVVATISVPLALVGSRLLGGRVASSGYQRRQAEGELQAATAEQIAGHAIVRAFGLERYMLRHLRQQLETLGTLTANDSFLTRLVGRSTVYGAHLGQLVLYAVGVAMIFGGQLSVGSFVGFVGLLLNVGEAIRSLSVGLPLWLQAAGPMRRIDELLAEQSVTPDAADATPLESVTGEIELRDVYFSHDNRQPTLTAISLRIPPRSRVAIVGASGSGKSTLLGVMMGSLDPDRGAVLVDGHELRGVQRASWQAQISVVLAEAFLFGGTVADNIRLGRPGATEAEIEAAAHAAQVHDDIISSMPDGYATDVGERGARLSTGQRQRIALARALLRQAPILLLDEATSALDVRTEAEFNHVLASLAYGRTVISVTHRLGAAIDADTIVVLREGRLVQQGTHTQLVADADGDYARLWAHQHGFGLQGDGIATRARVQPERLREIPLFKPLSLSALVRLADDFVTHYFTAGQVVLKQGDPGDDFYVVVRGSLDVVFSQPDGEEVALTTLEDGDLFGELALLEHVPRTATVRTRTECVLLSLAREHFERLLAQAPEVAAAIRDLATARARQPETLAAPRV